MLHTAMPMNKAHSQDEICTLLRPAACPAWNISTSELVQPVIMAMKPATTADGEVSANGRSGRSGTLRISFMQAFLGAGR
ncbi:hypothetical protein ALP75_204242 [Pseudomonas syringae pv. actinidiae]|nr:hypothetical protein ALP75_204242 [Pseudomonas syringae pv. actinidiae]